MDELIAPVRLAAGAAAARSPAGDPAGQPAEAGGWIAAMMQNGCPAGSA
jgi:hypothetical protein